MHETKNHGHKGKVSKEQGRKEQSNKTAPDPGACRKATALSKNDKEELLPCDGR